MTEKEFLREISKSTFSFTRDTEPIKKDLMNKLEAYGLVELIGKNKYRLTQKGYLANEIGFEKWLAENKRKQILEDEKIRVELDLAEKTLKEFPKTKWFARVGFIIGIILLIKEVIELIIELKN